MPLLRRVLGTIPPQLILKSNLVLSNRNPHCCSATAAKSLLEIKIETISGIPVDRLRASQGNIYGYTHVVHRHLHSDSYLLVTGAVNPVKQLNLTSTTSKFICKWMKMCVCTGKYILQCLCSA